MTDDFPDELLRLTPHDHELDVARQTIVATLCNRYGLDPQADELAVLKGLVIGLLEDRVPAWNQAARPGRPKEQSDFSFHLFATVAAIQQLARNSVALPVPERWRPLVEQIARDIRQKKDGSRRAGVASICTRLSKAQGSPWKGRKPSRLRDRYYVHKRQIDSLHAAINASFDPQIACDGDGP